MMKWYNSIFAKVTILFVFALVALGICSFYFVQMQNSNEYLEVQRKYNQFIATINQIVRHGGDITLVEKYLQELNFKVVRNPKIQKELSVEIGNDFDGVVAKVLRNNDVIYMLIQTPQKITLYRDNFGDSFKSSYVFAFAAFFVLIFLYLLILKALMPLRDLRIKIHKFSEGKTDTSYLVMQDDEIGELSREFDAVVKQINSLNHARHLFLRTIMHELKTPITKGRIVAEMVTDITQKNRLISILERLNSLIESFAKIEEMSSKNYQVTKKKFSFQEILAHVFEQLLIDPHDQNFPIAYTTQDIMLKADFEMLSLAMKNLIDNGLKYKTEGKVEIEIQEDMIVISSQSAPLLYPIEEYFKPFFKDVKNPHSKGLGLGLYIIKNTLEVQGLKLQYIYQQNKHYFYIIGAIASSKSKKTQRRTKNVQKISTIKN